MATFICGKREGTHGEAGRVYNARTVMNTFDITLQGQWHWRQRWSGSDWNDPCLLDVYGYPSQIIGRVFAQGINTPTDLAVAEILAGMRPQSIPEQNAVGVRFLFPDQAGAIAAGDPSSATQLVDPDQAEALVALYEEAEKLTVLCPDRKAKYRFKMPEAWTKKAQAIKLTVNPPLCDISGLVAAHLLEDTPSGTLEQSVVKTAKK
jgi:hypothetical protein